ncbi:MAG: hypothetical protein DI539_09445 [Flavobacterium psychrophilum]|nr:MAG: hypothetical protein DI539_09445 [Flavobacterium psychrophilum]
MLSQEENEKLLREEMEALRTEILEVYNDSGKRVSGEFKKGLEIEYNGLTAVLKGYTYLGGRRAGKMPPLKAIEDWVKAKGLKPIEDDMTTSSLAYLIARKIAAEGTNKENHLTIYSKVITPQRIDQIIQKINRLNVSAFINEVQTIITTTFNQYQ